VNAGAVIVRELRAESRRAANYWLRVVAAGTLIFVFASIMLTSQLNPSTLGAALFIRLNQTLLFAFWILVPLMTADCVSREKREGTLGLLFLTPLTVLDVIAGKAAIHVLRALTLFLAAMPVLGLPLVLGGVDWRWVLLAAVGQANAVLLGIAAGIYASTRGGSTIQVMVLAEGCAAGLAAISIFGTILLAFIVPGRGMGFTWLMGFVGTSIACSLILFVLILAASVRRLQETWQEESAAPEQPRWVKLFSNSDFWQSFFRWDTSRTLDRNPVAWLQEYSWTARLTKWGWVVLVLLAEFVVLTNDVSYRSPLWQPLVVVALGLGVAFSAVGSFRREQETGLLELLLVTPLSVRQFIGGRFWGIGCHYLPALAILWVGWTGDRLLNPRFYNSDLIAAIWPNPMVFVLMIVLGLYLSLGRLNFFLAWLLTWITAFVLPALARVGLGRIAGAGPLVASGLPLAFQVGLATLLWFLLHRKVRQREFAVGKSDRHLLL
jgi:ABC-type transport system involved in multi-copper enzyme maturation permease subunit